MNQEQIAATLRLMEHIRELSYEAETKAEERRLVREYKRLWEEVEPHLNRPTAAPAQ